MDTDLLVISFGTDDLFNGLKILQQKSKMFDFSKLENNLELYDDTNKKDPANFKIKTLNSLDTDEFISLGAKVYVYTHNAGKREKFKGSTKAASRNVIFKRYKARLNNEHQQKKDF